MLLLLLGCTPLNRLLLLLLRSQLCLQLAQHVPPGSPTELECDDCQQRCQAWRVRECSPDLLQQHVCTHGVDADLHYVMVSHRCAVWGLCNSLCSSSSSSSSKGRWCWYQHQMWLLQQHCLAGIALV
jgi:hypothetical protein